MSGSVADTVEVRQGCLPSRVFSRIIDSLGEHHEGDTTRLTCLYITIGGKTLPFVDDIVLIVGCAAVLMEFERKSTHARTRPSLQFPAKQHIHVCNNITMNGLEDVDNSNAGLHRGNTEQIWCIRQIDTMRHNMAAATMRRQSTDDSAYNTYARQHCVKLSGKQKPMLVNVKRKVLVF